MKQLEHYRGLDGIRAIAALMIMFLHFFKYIRVQGQISFVILKLAFLGQTGVSLFFVLSGFLITRILLSTKSCTNYFRVFYIRRALRIFPLYYLFLIIYYFLLPILQNRSIATFDKQIWYWLYLQNLELSFNRQKVGPAHLWSLAVEEHFYMVWPIVIYYLNLRRVKAVIIGSVVIAFIAQFIWVERGYHIFYFNLSMMNELAVGAFLAILEMEGRLAKGNAKIFTALFFLLTIPSFILWWLSSGLGLGYIEILRSVILSFGYFGLIAMGITIGENNWLKKILSHPLLIYTGKISYGLYVYHPICFLLLRQYINMGNVFISFVLSFAVAFLMAGLSYRFFESRFLLLKSKFNYVKTIS